MVDQFLIVQVPAPMLLRCIEQADLYCDQSDQERLELPDHQPGVLAIALYLPWHLGLRQCRHMRQGAREM